VARKRHGAPPMRLGSPTALPNKVRLHVRPQNHFLYMASNVVGELATVDSSSEVGELNNI
jgi:hypothetical protein